MGKTCNQIKINKKKQHQKKKKIILFLGVPHTIRSRKSFWKNTDVGRDIMILSHTLMWTTVLRTVDEMTMIVRIGMGQSNSQKSALTLLHSCAWVTQAIFFKMLTCLRQVTQGLRTSVSTALRNTFESDNFVCPHTPTAHCRQ